jgi:hypothetical protein
MTREPVRADTPSGYSLNSLSDEDLVVRAKIGDGLSYAELCRRHSGMATRITYRIVRNNEDTEDILQEAVLKGYRHRGGFDAPRNSLLVHTDLSQLCTNASSKENVSLCPIITRVHTW